MANNSISLILKQQRNLSQMTPEQVVSKLSEYGISISVKALYAYESGISLPKVPTFLALCEIYNIRDIMTSFGYTASLCVDENEWSSDQYEDFFKASLYEKIFLLAKWGIPSFAEYESLMTQPSQIVLSDHELSLVRLFRRLDEQNKSATFSFMNAVYEKQPGEKANSALKQA